MKCITKWMLAAALAVGGLGLTAAPAKAAQIGFYVGSGPGYIPPSPGPGYTWIAGYYNGGYWVPGRWAFAGNGFYRGRGFYRGYYRDRDDWYRGRGHFDRGRAWDRGRDRR
jgi:hypothetical protein